MAKADPLVAFHSFRVGESVRYVFYFFLFLSPSLHAVAQDLPNFQTVERGLYRSGRPTLQGMTDLQKIPIKTIIDLEDNSEAIASESMAAQRLGIKFISMPMSSFSKPLDSQVSQIEVLIATQSLRPLLVHCEHGMDRTGLIIGLYRVFGDKWPAQQAYREMICDGFRPLVWELDEYFKNKTHMR